MTNAVWPKRDSDLYWVRKDTVADIAALRAVVEHEDNHVRRVEAVDYDYEYSDDSFAVDDGDLYVKPTNVLLADPGRWLKASKGSQHQTLPDLLANPNPHAVTYSQAGASAAIHAAQHGTGQPDEVAIDGAQVTTGTVTTTRLSTGATAADVCVGNDTRLSDARTPLAHKVSHQNGGTDEVALDGSQITTGTVALARHPESIENLDKWANGAALDHPEVTVDVDTGVVYCNVEKMGGGNVRVQLGETTLTYTAGRVALSAGTDTVPVKNFCYIWDNGGTATLANVVGDHDSVPGGIEHVPVGEFYVQSAASVNTDGAYKVHVWTDLLAHDNGQSHIKYLNERLRQENASWKEGVATTLALTTNGGSADNVLFSTTVGEVYQLHEHDFPVFATGSDVYVVNQFGTPFDKVTDLNVLLTDALGAAIGNDRRFSLVIWGCVSEDTGDCKLYCNLPNGDYKKDAEAIQDKNRLVVYDIPAEFKGTGFLIAELILKYETAASGTWTEVLTRDLRGLLPSIAAGGGSVQGSEFSDADFRVFDDSDPTADLVFDASAISAGNTRTITMPDNDVDLGALITSEIANATPELTIRNTTAEDTDEGREGTVRFKGEQTGNEQTTLAKIEASHRGAADDEKGQLQFSTNDGSDVNTPTLAMTITDEQKVGIGTDTPAKLLSLVSAVEAGIQIEGTDGDGPFVKIHQQHATIAKAAFVIIQNDSSDAAADAAINFRADGQTFSIGVDSTDDKFKINTDNWFGGTDGIVIDSAGSVSLAIESGATGARPGTPLQGQMYFDTTIGKPIWRNGANWVDATGGVV